MSDLTAHITERLTERLKQSAHVKAQVMSCYQEATEEPWLSLYKVREGGVRALGDVKRLSYRELVERASVIAEQLKPLAPTHGRVLLSMSPHEGLYLTHLACLLADLTPAIFHPPNPKQSVEAFRVMCAQVLSSSEPALVIGDEGSEPLLAQVMAEQMVEGKLSDATQLAAFERLESGREGFDKATFKAQLKSAPTEVAFLQYSSGTTGAKKGVIFKHRELLTHVRSLAGALRLRAGERIASWLPLYHDMGFIACWLLPLLTATPLATLAPHAWVRRPESLLELITQERSTRCWLPNFAFSLLTHRVKGNLKRFNLSSLRQLISCSEFVSYPVMRDFTERFLKCGLNVGSLSSSYAMAENIFAVTHYPEGQPLQIITLDGEALARGVVERRYYGLPRTQTFISSGAPIKGVGVAILNEQQRPLPEGHVGTIAYKSETLFGGYLTPRGEEKLAAQDTRLGDRGEVYVTRDLGFFCEGHLYVLGRTDDVMIVGGKNLYPYDVEALLNDTEGLIPGRSVAISKREGGTEGVVVLAETRVSDTEELMRVSVGLKQRLSSALDIPISDVLLLPHMSLSKSTSGKLSRGKNRDRYDAGELTALALNKRHALGGGDEEESVGDDAYLNALKEALSEALNLPVGSLKPSTKLFSTALLDSFNAHLFFDLVGERLKGELSEARLAQLKAESVTLDELGAMAAWCASNIEKPQQPTPLVSSSASSSVSEEGGRACSRDVMWRHYFVLHGTPDNKMVWYQRVLALQDFPEGRFPLPGGGWLEGPNVRTETISTDEEGFRVSLYQGEILTREAWLKGKRRGILLGDSASFGVGVSDAETITSQLHEVNPDCLWFNASVRGGTLKSYTYVVRALPCQAADQVVLFSSGDFKLFTEQLNAVADNEATADELWFTFLERYQEDFLALIELVGKERFVVVHPPRLHHAPRRYQHHEADSFWRASAHLSKRVFKSYFTYHPLTERYQEGLSVFLEALCAEVGVRFLNLAYDEALDVDEPLFFDTSHYMSLIYISRSIMID